jgi:hypothetical protein
MRNPSQRAARSDKQHHDSLYPFRKIITYIGALLVLFIAIYKSEYLSSSTEVLPTMSEAAFILEAKAPLVVKDTEVPSPNDGEVLIKVRSLYPSRFK